MCIYTDNVCNQEVFQISFSQFVREAKYVKCVHSWWKKNVVLNAMSLKNILHSCNILEAETLLFADNTNILLQAEDGKVLEQKINTTMEVLYNWFDTNCLVINNEKSI
jgi:hypothetical protein